MKQARAALARDVAANMAREYVSKNPLVTKALLGAGMKIYSNWSRSVRRIGRR